MLERRRSWRRAPAQTLKRAGLKTFGQRFWDDEHATVAARGTGLALVIVIFVSMAGLLV